jgi:hypothetical protein
MRTSGRVQRRHAILTSSPELPASGNAAMDTILYRRFFVVVLVIAALGAITANVIIETRSGAYARSQASGWANPERCISGRLCLYVKSNLLAG